MKLSALHESNGLLVVIRNNKTGESIHVNFHKGLKSLPLQITMGDYRMDAQIHLKQTTTEDPNDDKDMELFLRVPGLIQVEDRPTPMPDNERIVPGDVIPEESVKPEPDYIEPQVKVEEPVVEEKLVEEEKPVERGGRRGKR